MSLLRSNDFLTRIPGIPRIGGSSGGGDSLPIPQLSPEEEDDLLHKIAHAGGSALSTVGHVLDTPGSFIRNILAGRNPLPGVFDPEQRASGRDVLEHAGFLRPNQVGLDAGDVAGFGLEVATDPLAWINPFGALGKGGQALEKAGLLGKSIKAADRVATGTRVGRMTTKVGDILAKASPEARIAAEAAAKGMGIDLAEHLDKPLGGLVGMGVPFMGHDAALSGPLSQAIGGKLDTVGQALRFGKIPGTDYSPGIHLNQLFNNSVGGAATRAGQEQASALFDLSKSDVSAMRGNLGREAGVLDKEGMLAPERNPDLRRMLEGVHEPTNPELAGVKDRTAGYQQNALDRAQMMGRNVSELQDPFIEHLYREGVGFENGGLPGQKLAGRFKVPDPAALARNRALTGLPGGTEDLRTIISDPDIAGLIQSAQNPATPLKLKDVVQFAKDRYGHLLAPELTPTTAGAEQIASGVATKPVDQMKGIVKLMAKLTPEQRAVGLFGNAPIADLERGLTRSTQANAATESTLQFLADHAAPTTKAAIQSGEQVPVKKILQALQLKSGVKDLVTEGMKPEEIAQALASATGNGKGALFDLARRKGVDASQELLDHAIPKSYAADLLRQHEGFTSPESVGAIGQGIDQFNSLFKAGVLTAPARHARDLMSGIHKNFSTGLIDASRMIPALTDAKNLARGGVVADAHAIPEVARILSERGIQATPEAGTQVLRELAYAHPEIAGRTSLPAAEMRAAVDPAAKGLNLKTSEQLLAQMPGARPVPLAETAQKILGRGEDLTINPLTKKFWTEPHNIGPVAASNDVGNMVHTANRLAPFIEQLRQGVHSSEAARKVIAAQIDYSAKALTPFERKVMTRAMPFYRYLKGAIPSTLNELKSAPGGKLAQTIRALTSAQSGDAIVPDYIKEQGGVRIPEGMPLIGGGPGSAPRYLTGLGMMFEKPIASIPRSPSEAFFNAARELGPIAKVPIELATGRSLFQRGAEGPVSLADQDPLIGRLLANASGQEKPVKLPASVEEVAANTPLARILNSARTATDSRKSVAVKALNLGSGLKFADIPPARQDSILRELTDKAMQEAGAKTFQDVHFPREVLSQMNPQELQAAQEFRGLQAILARRAKERAKAKVNK